MDGDTLEVAARRRGDGDGRIIGVDTPETVKPDTPVQCFGPQASRFEHEHVEGHRVRLLVGVEPRDVYGRLLAYVWIARPGKDPFLEEVLLRRGLARTLTFHPNDRFAHRFEGLEQKVAAPGKGSGMRAERLVCRISEGNVGFARSFATVPAAPQGSPL